MRLIKNHAAWLLLLAITGCGDSPQSIPKVNSVTKNNDRQTAEESATAQPLKQESTKMSQLLSPQAKQTAMLSPPGTVVTAMVTVTASLEQTRFVEEIAKAGGELQSWSDENHIANVQLEAEKLEELAKIDGVIYIESGGRMQH